jgi:hypothetical protein
MDDDPNPDSGTSESTEAPPSLNEAWQKRWRIVGAVTIAICAAMAGLGVNIQLLHDSKPLFFVYWGVFALLFFLTLYIIVLDLRYIRAQHAIATRDLFQNTIGDREFRQELNEAIRTASDDDPDDSAGTPQS